MSTPRKVRLERNTVRLMQKRREWRRRAIEAATCLVTWPAGKPGREKVEAEVSKTINKLAVRYPEKYSDTLAAARLDKEAT